LLHALTADSHAAVADGTQVIVEGTWSGAPSLHRGRYFVMHNDGTAPEAGANAEWLMASDMLPSSGVSWTVTCAPAAGSTATAQKDFELKYQASTTGITNAYVTIRIDGTFVGLA
jgi:hypothetical protein